MKRKLFLLYLAAFVGVAQGQLRISPARVIDIEGSLLARPVPRDWQGAPPTFDLVAQRPGARTGKVWLRKSPEGLVIAGHVNGPAPDFPNTAAQLMKKDHVEIWLAIDPDPIVQEITFGEETLPEAEKSCASPSGERPFNVPGDGDRFDAAGLRKCQEWARQQRTYRAYLKRLFGRQWQLAPKISAETFAVPAYQAMDASLANDIEPGIRVRLHSGNGGTGVVVGKEPDGRFLVDIEGQGRTLISGDGIEAEAAPAHSAPLYDPRLLPEVLKPAAAVPRLAAKTRQGGGYDFETVVPWRMFPPGNTADIQALYFMVEVFSPAVGNARNGPYSTTAPGRRYADFTSFNQVQLETPRRYEIGQCRDALPDGNFFIPIDATRITSLLSFTDAMYVEEPSGLSPMVTSTHLYSKEVSAGEYVCGPSLRHFKDGTGKSLELSIEEANFGFWRNPGGTLLIRDGPSTRPYGRVIRGYCGSCPVGELAIYQLSPDLSFTEMLEVETDRVDDVLEDIDMEISSDWNRVTVYLLKNGTWDNEVYCRSGSAYDRCGPVEHKSPPEPRMLKY